MLDRRKLAVPLFAQAGARPGSAGRLDLLRGRPRERAPARDVPPDAAEPARGPVSAHSRRRPEPGGAGRPPAGPAQLGWALVAVVAALIGGLAADRLVHTSLLIVVIVSLVAGA